MAIKTYQEINDELAERAAQEFSDMIDEEIIEELCAIAKNIDNYERAMEVVTEQCTKN